MAKSPGYDVICGNFFTTTKFKRLFLETAHALRIVFDDQASLKNQKMALLVGSSEGGIFREHWQFAFLMSLGTFFENEGFILVILILQAIQKSSISTIFSFFINFFEKIRG